MTPEKGRALGMPISKFTDAATHGLLLGSDQIVIGSIGPAEVFEGIIDQRRKAFENLAKILRGEH